MKRRRPFLPGHFGRKSLWSPLPVLRERVRVRVLPETARDFRFPTEPSPRPSPRVPGEGEVAGGRSVCFRGVLIAAAAIMLLTPPCGAQQVRLSLPLQGHYRDSRYMPVRVTVSGAGAKDARWTLRCDGALPVEFPLAGGEAKGVIAPMLVLGSTLGNARWSLSGGAETPAPFDTQPRALASDERLVAVATDSPDIDARQAAALFPQARVVPVALDTSQPRLLTPTAAWEALDGVVLDAPAAAKVTESQLRVLLAGGTVVAVRADAKPGGNWPWRREGPYWVLRHDVAGPQDVVDADVYEPTYASVRGWPASVRRQAVLAAVVFVILVLAVTLWRSRYAVWAALALCVIATGTVVAWGANRPPVLRAGGEVVARDAAAVLTQRDQWSYLSVMRPVEASHAFTDLTRPLFFTRRQPADFSVRLVCAADGTPERLVARIPENGTLAFLSRSVSPEPPGAAPSRPVTSPLNVLADRLYPGRTVGQMTPADAGAETWPTVVLERSAPDSRPSN